MPIFSTPPINIPPIINAVQQVQQITIDDTTRLEKIIVNGVLCSKKEYVLIKIGRYVHETAELCYEVPIRVCNLVCYKVGKIGIATRFVMSEYIPGTEGGDLYIFATRNPKAKVLFGENCSVRTF